MDLGVIATVLGLMIPITAIAGGIYADIVKKTQKHREEMARIQATHHFGLDANSRSELNTLRQELAALRDTTTQYDISVERNMQDVMQRLRSLESIRSAENNLDSAKADPAPPRPTPQYAPPSPAAYQPQPEEAPLRIQPGA